VIRIVETAFGSHLYGTDTPASDRDWKGVHLPPARDILLQRIERTVSSKTKADMTAKNTAADTDRESWALHQFFRLVSEGQTVAPPSPDMAFMDDMKAYRRVVTEAPT